jgi:hypothetical protein
MPLPTESIMTNTPSLGFFSFFSTLGFTGRLEDGVEEPRSLPAHCVPVSQPLPQQSVFILQLINTTSLFQTNRAAVDRRHTSIRTAE